VRCNINAARAMKNAGCSANPCHEDDMASVLIQDTAPLDDYG
jgi:hypothetical protein